MSAIDSKEVTEMPQEAGLDAPIQPARPTLWLLLRVWLMLGLQSFGGGMATLFLIRRAAVERHGWLTAAEFTADWALCQAAPGINLLCMTILIGWRVAGWGGALVSLVGLLLPSATLTIVMTALYADLRNLPVVQAALHGIVPATVGLGLLLTSSMARPLLVASRQESTFSLVVSVAILIGSAAAILFWGLPVIVVLCSAGAIGALTLWLSAHRRQPTPAKAQEAKTQTTKADHI
ncbi:MAG: chromate transporter [Caldilineaceae bacterium]